jgi:hypothetical protein
MRLSRSRRRQTLAHAHSNRISIFLLHFKSKLTSSNMATATQISKKRKFIADGVFQAELGEFL